MLLRRTVAAAGLAVALAGAGAGTAFAGTGGDEPPGAGVLASAPLQQQDDSALLDQQGVCADGSVAGDAGACDSETLGNGYVNACVRDDAGIVSDIAGGEGGVAEQAGLACADSGTTPVPPPGDGNGDEGDGGNGDNGNADGDGDGDDTDALNRAEPAEAAEAIEAEPNFTG